MLDRIDSSGGVTAKGQSLAANQTGAKLMFTSVVECLVIPLWTEGHPVAFVRS